MKRMIYLWAVVLIALASCQNQNGKVTIKDVQKAEKALFSQDQTVNPEAAKGAIETFRDFANQNPEDPQSPEYLFKALEVSVNTKQDAPTSIVLCEKLLKSFPEFDKNPVALFMVASFVYEEQLCDTALAHGTYQRIIKNYPDSPFAKDAAIAIEQLGMSPDELVRKFEQTEN